MSVEKAFYCVQITIFATEQNLFMFSNVVLFSVNWAPFDAHFKSTQVNRILSRWFCKLYCFLYRWMGFCVSKTTANGFSNWCSMAILRIVSNHDETRNEHHFRRVNVNREKANKKSKENSKYHENVRCKKNATFVESHSIWTVFHIFGSQVKSVCKCWRFKREKE